METRFKKFISDRRSRHVDSDAEPDTKNVANHSSTATMSQRPGFLARSLRRSAGDASKAGFSTVEARPFAYESYQPGKTPTFGSLPQKGNGPIKLQTSRRLDSGDLITTLPQDTQQTMNDIREGDYIVGRKERPISRSQHRTEPHARLNHASHSAPSQQVPFGSSPWLDTPKSSHESLGDHTNQVLVENPDTTIGLGLVQPMWSRLSYRTSEAISDPRTYSRKTSVSAESSRSSSRPTEETNATLEALKKAEYTKLVELYGPNAAARGFTRYHKFPSSSFPDPSQLPRFSPIVLEPLPLPSIDAESRRLSHSSSISESLDSGTSSPQRASFVSSVATGQTSLEDDSSTREDIRKMVEQMRSSYLTAIESRNPAPIKPRSRKATRSQKSNPPSSPSTTRSRRSHVAGTRTPPSAGLQTSYPTDTEREVPPQRWTNSYPPASFGRLSPIEASPPRNATRPVDLRRADSSTLGSLAADATRLKLLARTSRASGHSSTEDKPSLQSSRSTRPETDHTKSWLTLDNDSSDEAQGESALTIPDTELPSTNVNDLDGIFSNEVWSLSLSPTTTLGLLPVSKPCEIARPSTPTRAVHRISSIPESPEYTHLAKPGDAENNFI